MCSDDPTVTVHAGRGCVCAVFNLLRVSSDYSVGLVCSSLFCGLHKLYKNCIQCESLYTPFIKLDKTCWAPFKDLPALSAFCFCQAEEIIGSDGLVTALLFRNAFLPNVQLLRTWESHPVTFDRPSDKWPQTRRSLGRTRWRNIWGTLKEGWTSWQLVLQPCIQ